MSVNEHKRGKTSTYLEGGGEAPWERSQLQLALIGRMLALSQGIEVTCKPSKMNGIDHTKDPYPNERNIKDARTRYQNSLATGNRMPLMAKDQDQDIIGAAGSNKRKAVSQGDIYVKDKKLKSSDKLWDERWRGRATVTTGGRGGANRG